MTEAEEALYELAEGALAGPIEQAWVVFDRAWPALLERLAIFQRALGVRSDLRDDCGQAVMVRVWKGRTNYRGQAAPELFGWIHTICRREHLRLLDADAKRPRTESDLAQATMDSDVASAIEQFEIPQEQTTAGLVDSRDELTALEECLSRLGNEQREVTELLYSAAAFTEREVAQLLKCSKSQVNVLRKKALKALTACMEGRGWLDEAATD